MSISATVHLPSGVFLDAAHADDAAHVTVTLPRNPDHVRERYSGDPKVPIRLATAQEMAATAAAEADAQAARALDEHRALKALALVVADLTGKTPTQIANLVKTKYRSLS